MKFVLIHFKIHVIFAGPQLVEDECKRARIIEIKQQFIELVYEYSDIEDDDDIGNKAEPLTESQINCDLHQALNLGLERLKLMDEMHLKCRSRLGTVKYIQFVSPI